MRKQRPKSCNIRQQVLKLSDSIIKTGNDRYKQNETQPSPFLTTFPHSTPAKNYRIDEQDVYNYVRNSICDTFKQKTSRSYDLVKQLTSNTVPEKDQVIDRLCKKYSILRINKRSCFQNVQVNIQQIAKRYVKSRSKQKQKQEQKQRLKIDVAKNYRHGRNKQYTKSELFFSFDGNALKDLQNKYKNRSRSKQHTRVIFRQKKNQKKALQQLHPYIQLYQKAQKQVVQNISKSNKISLNPDFPQFPQPEQWQKNMHNMQKKMKKQRSIIDRKTVQSARARIGAKTNKPDFYLT